MAVVDPEKDLKFSWMIKQVSSRREEKDADQRILKSLKELKLPKYDEVYFLVVQLHFAEPLFISVG